MARSTRGVIETSALDSRTGGDNRSAMRTHAKIDSLNDGFAAAKNLLVAFAAIFICASSFATTKGLSQIVTPELEEEGDLSLSLQIQDKRIANPYELQAEMGLTRWAEVAVFRGFDPDDWIFATEFGLLTKEPYLLSVGFVNWSPHLNVDPQPYIEAGYCTSITKSSPVRSMPVTKTKRFSVTLMILISNGGCRSISRAGGRIPRRLDSLGTSRRTFKLIPRSISRIITRID